MDINDVILSLGGVDSISEPLPINATDAEIQYHLDNHCEGESIPTLAQVKAQRQTLLNRALADARLSKNESIKAHRDYLTLNGGHKMGNYWYHSNEISLIQQLALSGLANQMAAGGAPDSAAIIATPWKTMSGEYVTLTVGIAKNFVLSALAQQGAIFTAAKNKMDEVSALTTVEAVNAYDEKAGFPTVYTPA